MPCRSATPCSVALLRCTTAAHCQAANANLTSHTQLFGMLEPHVMLGTKLRSAMPCNGMPCHGSAEISTACHCMVVQQHAAAYRSVPCRAMQRHARAE